jgi:putative ABC transport system substrate-binding protein
MIARMAKMISNLTSAPMVRCNQNGQTIIGDHLTYSSPTDNSIAASLFEVRMRLHQFNRREIIAVASAMWPLQVVRAQQSENLARIGFLPFGSPSNQHDLSWVEVFRTGLIKNGLVEGRNVILDVVWVPNDSEYDQAVAELVRRGAAVLVPVGSSASAACKRQTSTIPIVFLGVGNPVGIGLVESLSHPGGNVTGFADLTVDLSGKLLEFARELTPALKPIGYLWHDKWMDGQNRLLAIELRHCASSSSD